MEKILQAAFPYLEARQSASLTNHPPHIDKFYASLASFKKLALYPMIAFQSKEPALYSKAMDNFQINLSFNTFVRINERFSYYFSYFLLFYFIYYIFVYFFHSSVYKMNEESFENRNEKKKKKII